MAHALACCITNVANTYSDFVCNTAFPLPQWLHERDLTLHFTYVPCLVIDQYVSLVYIVKLSSI